MSEHKSDCATHNAPALPAMGCDCGIEPWALDETIIHDKLYSVHGIRVSHPDSAMKIEGSGGAVSYSQAVLSFPHGGTLQKEWIDAAKLAVKSLNAFAALAEHLGCKPEDLNVDLVKWYGVLKKANKMPNIGAGFVQHEARQALAALEK